MGPTPPPLMPPVRPARAFGTILLMLFVCLHGGAILGLLMLFRMLVANYPSVGVQLPPVTQALLRAGDVLRAWWFVAAPLSTAGMVVVVAWAVRSRSLAVRASAHGLFWLTAAGVIFVGAAALLPYAALLKSLTTPP